jgi:hypothetical protein
LEARRADAFEAPDRTRVLGVVAVSVQRLVEIFGVDKAFVLRIACAVVGKEGIVFIVT